MFVGGERKSGAGFLQCKGHNVHVQIISFGREMQSSSARQFANGKAKPIAQERSP